MIQGKEVTPIIESSSLSGGDAALRSNEWKAVPDIWRSSADKYGDKVALVDPYHDPPLKLTYNQVYVYCRCRYLIPWWATEFIHLVCFIFQLEQEILDFSEGLRAVGVKPDEKIALFADNSCRWLVSDQGTWLLIWYMKSLTH